MGTVNWWWCVIGAFAGCRVGSAWVEAASRAGEHLKRSGCGYCRHRHCKGPAYRSADLVGPYPATQLPADVSAARTIEIGRRLTVNADASGKEEVLDG
ncbi:hypothetical protein EV651_1144 [Kribbella sp. VKM Ac-2571]|nr:hypothetical protein EV651_1144 [Kribbella sp. VKM Ac-2571]